MWDAGWEDEPPSAVAMYIKYYFEVDEENI
jgi:hypothetical protein